MNFGTFLGIRLYSKYQIILNRNKSFSGNDSGLLRDVNTICRRSWYIAAHVWKIYDFRIEVVPFIINFSTELTTVVKFEV